MNKATLQSPNSEERPTISVIIYAREAQSSIGATLASLASQAGIDEAEVIVADASDDGTGEIIKRDFPWVRHLELGPCTMPEGKSRGIEVASGEFIAILDAYDEAQPEWLLEIKRGFSGLSDNVQAIGGEVIRDGPLDGANGPGYLFEYGAFVPELESGPTAGDLPGNNVAYRRRVFEETCAEMLSAGFYKPLFHDAIRAAGGALHIHPQMRVKHHIRTPLLAFCARRFQYGRCFGAIRLQEATWFKKLLYILLVPAVPPLLTVRHLRRSWQNPRNRAVLLKSLPGLVLLCCSWGCGEWLGTWFGPGNSWKMVY